MKKVFALLLILNIVFATLPLSHASSGSSPAPESCDYVANEVIITQKKSGADKALPLETAELIDSDALEEDERLIKGTVAYGTDIESFCRQLEQRPDVVRADPNYLQQTAAITLPSEARQTGSDYNGFNWYKESLHLTEAWQSADTLGSEQTVVAVIDTGANIYHKEFEGALWNDGNGNHGYNAVDNDYNLTDNSGHGTHVAGIIAMRANDFGYVGIAPHVKLMILKATAGETFEDTAILTCLNYALEHGADIINLSLGGTNLSDTMAKAYQRAARKAVIIAAAGNNAAEASDTAFYPAACSGVIGVMSYGSNKNADKTNYTIDNGKLTSFSNFDVSGKYYQIAAPGVKIIGPSSTDNEGFVYKSGTSQAAPIVSGAAALYLSVHPDANPYQVRQALVEGSAQTVTTLTGDSSCKRIDIGGVLAQDICADETLSVSEPVRAILSESYDETLTAVHRSDTDALDLLSADVLADYTNDLSFLTAFRGLRSLDLRGLDLTDESVAFLETASFPLLYRLNLSANSQLTGIRLRAENMPALRELIAYNCALESTAGFESLTDLRIITLSGNRFFTSYQFETFERVTKLDLHACRLQDVHAFAVLTSLVHLNISDNYITDLSPLCTYRGAVLNVSANPLSLGDRQDYCIKSIEAFMKDNACSYESISFKHENVGADDGKTYIPARSLDFADMEYPRALGALTLAPHIAPAGANTGTACLFETQTGTLTPERIDGTVQWNPAAITEDTAVCFKAVPVAGFAAFDAQVTITVPRIVQFACSDTVRLLIANAATEAVHIGDAVLTSYTAAGNYRVFDIPESITPSQALTATAWDSIGAGGSLTNSENAESQSAQAKIISFTSDKEKYFTNETVTLTVQTNTAAESVKLVNRDSDQALILNRFSEERNTRIFTATLTAHTAKTCHWKAYAGANGIYPLGAKVLDFTIRQAPTNIKLSSESGAYLYFSDNQDTMLLEAKLYPSGVSGDVHFESADPSVAVVDQSGLVSAVSYGSTVITATTANGLSTAYPVSVRSPQLKFVAMTEDYYDTENYLEFYTAGATDLVLKNTDGSDVAFSYRCESEASDRSGYDRYWLVTLYPGSPEPLDFLVYAADERGITAQTPYYAAHLEPLIAPESFCFTQSSYTFPRAAGEARISLEVLPLDCNEYFNWSISSNTVAYISASGTDYVVLTPRKTGTLTLTASATIGGKEVSEKATVTFTESPIYEALADKTDVLIYEPFEVTVKTDTSISYLYLENPVNGFACEYSAYCFYDDADGVRTWKVPYYYNIAGEAFTVTGGDSIGNLSAAATSVAVTAQMPESGITGNPPVIYGAVGTRLNASLIRLPDRSWIHDSAYTVSFDDASIASFSLGNLRLLAEGQTVMHCTYEGQSADVHIIAYAPIKAITLPQDNITLTASEQYTLSPVITPQSTQKLNYASSDDSVASVDENGKITAHGAGTATVTVSTADGISAALTVKVQADAVPSYLLFDKTQYTLCVGKKLSYHLLSDTALTNLVQFSSSNTDILTVNDAGVYTAKKEGTVTVYARTQNGLFAEAVVACTAHRVLGISSAYLDMVPNQNSLIYPTINPAGVDVDGCWLSDNEQVAVVSQLGVISAKSAGICHIFFITDQGESVSCTVRVTAQALTRISLAESTVSLGVFEHKIISYTKTPAAAQAEPVWSSSNARIADVDANGIVYGVSAGTAYINALLENGSYYTVLVTVTAAEHTLSGSINTKANIESEDLLGNTETFEIENDFALDDVQAGTYTLTIDAPHHTTLTIEAVTVNADVPLGALHLHNGDANGDGVVDIGDISLMLRQGNYGSDTAVGNPADITDDGHINLADVAEVLLKENYGGESKTLVY